MDICVSLAALPLALPLLSAACAAIRAETPGSPIFRQVRVGLGGQKITVIKLRTMVQDAAEKGAGLYAEENDWRFTSVGKVLRRFSIDELPQIINVLKGDMSIVGPRPMVPSVVESYPDEYEVILQVKPGITGLSQVSGRNELPRSERLRYDMEYAQNASIWTDLAIIFKTLGVVVTGEGQRNDQGKEDVEK